MSLKIPSSVPPTAQAFVVYLVLLESRCWLEDDVLGDDLVVVEWHGLGARKVIGEVVEDIKATHGGPRFGEAFVLFSIWPLQKEAQNIHVPSLVGSFDKFRLRDGGTEFTFEPQRVCRSLRAGEPLSTRISSSSSSLLLHLPFVLNPSGRLVPTTTATSPNSTGL